MNLEISSSNPTPTPTSTEIERPSKINRLPEILINQIKAGEVIERPGNLLKELLENAIDAKATKIDIIIENNGLNLIAVIDNGEGMSEVDLPLAFERHLTSKIKKFEDLYQLQSYGFRGEALASIKAVSRVHCESLPRNKNLRGGKIFFEDGQVKKMIPLSQDQNQNQNQNQTSGTQIYVKDLFYNTPVRHLFFDSKISEKNFLLKVIGAFVLTCPQIQFTLTFDFFKEKKIFTFIDEEKIRLNPFFRVKNKLDESDLKFNGSFYQYNITGLIPLKSSMGSSKINSLFNNTQFILVNQRLVEDPKIHKLIVYHIKNKFPQLTKQKLSYFIFIEVPLDQLDVNVHPHKTTVKFAQSSVLYALLTSSLTKALDVYDVQFVDQIEEKNKLHQDSPINIGTEELQYHQNHQNHQNQFIELVKSQYYLYLKSKPEHEFKLVNLKKLMGSYLEFFFNKLRKEPPHQTSFNSLLIPTTFFVAPLPDEEKIIHFLFEHGFIVERLSPSLLCLRKVANFLKCFDTEMMLKLILDKNQNEAFLLNSDDSFLELILKGAQVLNEFDFFEEIKTSEFFEEFNTENKFFFTPLNEINLNFLETFHNDGELKNLTDKMKS
jgi:DNA mismatch repair protein MutL